MPFALFCCKVRSLSLRLMYVNKSGVFLFVGFSASLSVLIEIYESSRYDWTDDHCREANDMLDLLSLRVELQDAYVEMLVETEAKDSIGNYCLN